MKRLILLSLLTGCSLAPRYQEPLTLAPENWKSATVQDDALPMPQSDCWWEFFGDQQLNCLIAQALAKSPTLDQAYARVLEARAIQSEAFAAFFPQIYLAPNTSSTGSLIPYIEPTMRDVFNLYTFPFAASYEVDLFGKIRNGYFAAKANADAQAYAYDAVQLSLEAEVASTYYLVRSLDSQIEVLNRSILSRQDAFDVNTARFDAGLVNYTDVTRASNQLTTAKADLAIIQQARARAENALATLLGISASCYCYPYDPLEEITLAAAPGFPSSLVMQRPDIAEAERRLAADNALIGVARSAYFPSFQINGALGYQSSDFDELFEWKSRFWSWGTETSQLIFNGGKTAAINRAAKARFLQELASYTQIVLRAFEEVESSLSAQRLTRESYLQLKYSVESARETRSLSHERYLQGLVTYLDVTEAERNLLIDELRHAQSRLETYRSTINLIRAVGGGFQRSE